MSLWNRRGSEAGQERMASGRIEPSSSDRFAFFNWGGGWGGLKEGRNCAQYFTIGNEETGGACVCECVCVCLSGEVRSEPRAGCTGGGRRVSKKRSSFVSYLIKRGLMFTGIEGILTGDDQTWVYANGRYLKQDNGRWNVGHR